MSIVKPTSTVIRSEYDRTEKVVKEIHQVSFDLHELVQMVEELIQRRVTGTQLQNPPLKLRQLCDQEKNINANANNSNTQIGKSRIPAAAASSSFNNEFDSSQQNTSTSSKSKNTFAQALWDRAVHLYRLLRHLSQPLHTVPVLHYTPGELLTKIDAYNTELELLLLRSRSGKATGEDELCFQFVRGNCPRGASCSFSHSRTAVTDWARRWTSNHLMDFTDAISLIRCGHAAGDIHSNNHNKHHHNSRKTTAAATSASSRSSSGGGGKSSTTTPNTKRTSSNNNKNTSPSPSSSISEEAKKKQQAKSKEKQFHDFQSGAMLRFEERIGPEAFAVVIEQLLEREKYAREVQIGRESPLFSIVVRFPFTRALFDVFCSVMEMGYEKQKPKNNTSSENNNDNDENIQQQQNARHNSRHHHQEQKPSFDHLRVIDLAKCDLYSVGRHRLAKLGKVLRRYMAAACVNRFYYQQQQQNNSLNSDDNNNKNNKMLICLGNNNLANFLSGSLLTHFVAAGPASKNSALAHAQASSGIPNASSSNPNDNSNVNVTNASITSPNNTSNVNNASFTTNVSQSAAYMTPAGTGGGNLAKTPKTNMSTIQQQQQQSATSTQQQENSVGVAIIAPNDSSSYSADEASFLGLDNNNNASASSTNIQNNNNTNICKTPLLSINLEFNQIGPMNPDFSDFISGVNDALPFLEKLSLCGNPIVNDGAQRLFPVWRNSSLKYLDVSCCGLGDRGVIALCDSLKSDFYSSSSTPSSSNPSASADNSSSAQNQNNNTPIVYLNISWNGITAEGIASVAELLKHKPCELQCLKLDYNPALGRRGAILLSQALKENTSIRRLDMKWCHIADEGCLAIMDALGTGRNNSLAVFKFDKSEADSRTIEQLHERLSPVFEQCKHEIEKLELEMVW